MVFNGLQSLYGPSRSIPHRLRGEVTEPSPFDVPQCLWVGVAGSALVDGHRHSLRTGIFPSGQPAGSCKDHAYDLVGRDHINHTIGIAGEPCYQALAYTLDEWLHQEVRINPTRLGIPEATGDARGPDNGYGALASFLVPH